jgi:hypothetical protein
LLNCKLQCLAARHNAQLLAIFIYNPQLRCPNSSIQASSLTDKVVSLRCYYIVHEL